MTRSTFPDTVCSILLAVVAAINARAALLLDPPVLYRVGNFATGVTASDVTGDGIVDIVTTNVLDRTLSLLPGLGSGGFGAERTIPLDPHEPRDVVAADLDGDGIVDLAVALRNVGPLLAVLPGLGEGAFGAPAHYGTGSAGFSMAAGDFDGDGDVDIVVATAQVGDALAVVFRNNGKGVFDAGTNHLIASTDIIYIADVEVADVDGDGVLDLLVMALNSDTIGVMRGSGDGRFGAIQTVPLEGVGFPEAFVVAIAPADLDGDGRVDLLALVADFPDDNQLLAFRNAGSGGFEPARTYPVPDVIHSFTTPAALVGRDIDGDARDEVVLAGHVFPNLGDGTLGEIEAYGVHDDVLAATTGDFDADGDADVVITTREVGFTSSAIVLSNGRAGAADLDGDGAVGFGDLLIILAAWGPCPGEGAACPADLDADGDVDFADLLVVLAAWTAG